MRFKIEFRPSINTYLTNTNFTNYLGFSLYIILTTCCLIKISDMRAEFGIVNTIRYIRKSSIRILYLEEKAIHRKIMNEVR